MIDIRLPQPDGTVRVHTFHRITDDMKDEKTLWSKSIHNVVGYTVDPNASRGCSMISLARVEWKKKMLDEYEDDCIEAARLLATRCGITFGKDEQKVPRRETRPKFAKGSVESIMLEMIDSNEDLTKDGKPELPVLNRLLDSAGIERIGAKKRDELFDKITAK